MSGPVLCAWDELTEGEPRAVELDGRELLVVRLGDGAVVVDRHCTHQDVSLIDGEVDVDERCIECPKHGAAFRLDDGTPLSLPATRPLGTVPVEVVDGQVMVVDR